MLYQGHTYHETLWQATQNKTGRLKWGGGWERKGGGNGEGHQWVTMLVMEHGPSQYNDNKNMSNDGDYDMIVLIQAYIIGMIISRVSDQNGVSPLYIMLEIHHSGREPSVFAAEFSVLHSWLGKRLHDLRHSQVEMKQRKKQVTPHKPLTILSHMPTLQHNPLPFLLHMPTFPLSVFWIALHPWQGMWI